jgi:hypothetical protein
VWNVFCEDARANFADDKTNTNAPTNKTIADEERNKKKEAEKNEDEYVRNKKRIILQKQKAHSAASLTRPSKLQPASKPFPPSNSSSALSVPPLPQRKHTLMAPSPQHDTAGRKQCSFHLNGHTNQAREKKIYTVPCLLLCERENSISCSL